VWAAARPALSKHGLAVTQTLDENRPDTPPCVRLITTLMHASGEWIAGTMEMPVQQQNAQGFGSAITYARRYALAAILGIAADDDDGEGAVQRTTSTPVHEALPPPKKATPRPRAVPSPEPSPVVTDLPEPAAHPIAQLEHDIQAASSVKELAAVAIRINDANLEKTDQAYLRPIYTAKKKLLEPPASSPEAAS
jgi:hypothetical protein